MNERERETKRRRECIKIMIEWRGSWEIRSGIYCLPKYFNHSKITREHFYANGIVIHAPKQYAKRRNDNHKQNIGRNCTDKNAWRGIVFSAMRLTAPINRFSLCVSPTVVLRSLCYAYDFHLFSFVLCRKWPRLSCGAIKFHIL